MPTSPTSLSPSSPFRRARMRAPSRHLQMCGARVRMDLPQGIRCPMRPLHAAENLSSAMTSPRISIPGAPSSLATLPLPLYSYVGSTYTAETQYAIGRNRGDYVNAFYFNAYTVYTSITCQWAPDEITTPDGPPFTGSGKFEKSPSKIVKKVQQTIERRDHHAVVYNPFNWYQNSPINYYSEFTLGYVKPSSPLSML